MLVKDFVIQQHKSIITLAFVDMIVLLLKTATMLSIFATSDAL